jgi:2-polyprenyl-6-hydroxyphenyl methylase/3-demethylubiquinone-9 3-methyltransferase
MNAKVVLDMWAQHKSGLRVLDFGGGNDALCTALRDNGFAEALTYDPMMPQYAQRPEGKFDLVTSFETIEHLSDPMAAVASIVESAAVPGLVFFTTTIQPLDFDTVGLNWWYVAPRNGHVSIFSRQALTAAWARHGYKVVSVDSNTHIAFHTLPSYCNIGALAGDQVKE